MYIWEHGPTQLCFLFSWPLISLKDQVHIWASSLKIPNLTKAHARLVLQRTWTTEFPHIYPMYAEWSSTSHWPCLQRCRAPWNPPVSAGFGKGHFSMKTIAPFSTRFKVWTSMSKSGKSLTHFSNLIKLFWIGSKLPLHLIIKTAHRCCTGLVQTCAYEQIKSF